MQELKYIAIIAALCLLFFSTILYNPSGLIYSNVSDIVHQYYPYIIFLKSNLEKGILPLWNPLLMAGLPWAASPDTNTLYPPTLIASAVLPPHLAVNYLIVFHIFLAGLFMYLYLREVKVPSQPSLFGALAFMFSGFILVRVYAGHFSIINSISWIPLIFLLIEKTVKSKSALIPMLLGAVYSLQFLGSQPQIPIYTFIASSFYYLYRHFSEKTDYSSILKTAAIALAMFLGISAIQILPAYEMLKLSVRGNGLPYDQLTSASLPPAQLISLILPEFFGTSLDYTKWGESNFWELSSYVGILTIILAGIALLTNRDKLTFFYLALIAFSILYAFGKFNPFFDIVSAIPFLNTFRIPSRFLLFFSFSISVLAAIGMNKFLHNYQKMGNLNKLLSVLVAICLIVVAGSLLAKQKILESADLFAQQRLAEAESDGPISSTVSTLLAQHGVRYFTDRIFNHIIENIATLTISLLALMAVYKLVQGKSNLKKFVPWLIILILLFDLWTFGLKYNSRTLDVGYESKIDLPDKSDYRIVSPPEIYLIDEAELTKRSIQRFDGYYVAKLDDYDKFYEAARVRPNLMKIGNVAYYFVNNGTAILQESLPRAFFVYSSNVILNSVDQFTAMANDDFDPEKTLIIGNRLAEIDVIVPLNITSYEANSVEIEVNNKAEGYLVLLDKWYPGWKVYIDGKEGSVLKAYGIMRGVEINSNVKSVKFSFEPETFKIGSYITAISLSVLIITSILTIRKRSFRPRAFNY